MLKSEEALNLEHCRWEKYECNHFGEQLDANRIEDGHISCDLVTPHPEIYPKISGQRSYEQKCFCSLVSNSNTKM